MSTATLHCMDGACVDGAKRLFLLHLGDDERGILVAFASMIERTSRKVNRTIVDVEMITPRGNLYIYSTAFKDR